MFMTSAATALSRLLATHSGKASPIDEMDLLRAYTINECPQSKISHSQRNILHCDRCPLFLGKSSDNKVSCFYNAWFAIKAGQQLPQLPPIGRVKKQYDTIIDPYSIKVSLPNQSRTLPTRTGQIPFYDNRRRSPKQYRKLVNSGKIRF